MAREPGLRYLFIDALRGLAALSVVLFHAEQSHQIDGLLDTLPGAVRTLLQHGYLGVEVFFVLSGFVIAHSTARDQVTPGYTARFLLRRSLRLDPPYWTSIIVAVGFAWLSARFVPGKVFEPPTFGRVLSHMFYLQELLGLPPLSPVYWTLCLEVQFYATFCLLMLLATRLRARLPEGLAFYAVTLPAVVFADLWPLGLSPFEVRGLFVNEWHLFLLGVLVWRAVFLQTDRRATVIASVNIALVACGAAFHHNVETTVGALVGLLILLAGLKGRLFTWLAPHPFQLLGAMSYSMYLIHAPVGGATFRVGYRLTGRSITTEGVWFVLEVAMTLLAAYLFHRLIERPSISLSRRIRLSPAPPKPAAQMESASARS